MKIVNIFSKIILVFLFGMLITDCNSNLYKKYLNSHGDKSLYIPSGVLSPDTAPPDINSVTATSHSNVRVVFLDQSSKLDEASAVNTVNYRIQYNGTDPQGGDLPVTAAKIVDGLTVDLTVQTEPKGMIHNASYTLAVTNVADINGNAISAKTLQFTGRGQVVAELSGAPSSPTNVSTLDITVGGTDIVAFKYKIDGADWSVETPVATHLTSASQSDGAHTLEVVARDSLGNWQDTNYATTFGWTVDTMAPGAVLSSTPAVLTYVTDADIVVGGTGVVAYKFRIDSSQNFDSLPEIAAGTHIAQTGLPDGTHTVEVIGRDAAGNWQSGGAPSSYTWTIDTVTRMAELSGLPSAITNVTSTSITVGGPEIIEYAYQIDGGVWNGGIGYPLTGIDISSTIDIASLGEGPHTIAVIGLSGAGVWQPEGSPTSWSWTIDTTAPTAAFTVKPLDPDNNQNPSFSVGGAGVATYRYRIDSGIWTGLISQSTSFHPTDLAGTLSEGPHTVEISGCDLAGNEQYLVAPTTSYTWTVDITAPTAVLSNTPSALVNVTTTDIAVGGADVTKYKYRLFDNTAGSQVSDWSGATDIATHIQLSSLLDHSYTLSVVGRDAAGNWQDTGSATTVTWSIDTASPTASLSNTPPSPTNQTGTDIIVGGTDVVSYKYKLDSGSWSSEVTDLGTHIALSGLSAGTYTLSVIGKDLAGNWQSTGSPTTFSWTIDLSVPTAVLSNTPANPTFVTSTDITVGGPGIVAYQYDIDGGGYGAETVIATHIQLSGLSEAPHTLSVKAKNGAGTWQVSPTVYAWTVDTTAPTATLSNTPADPSNSASASITVGGTGVTAYQYKIDGGSYGATTPIATPITLSSLSDASHTLSVIGRDAAGNWQFVATTFTWTVDTIAPAAPAVSDAGAYNSTVNLLFTWTNAGDVAEVKMQIATDSGFATIVYGGSGGVSLGLVNNYTYAIDPLNGPRYYARVKVRDAAGNWSGWGTASDGIDVAGGISGNVKDTTNTVVSGATVNLYLVAGHVLKGTTSTNGSGNFTLSNVPIGSLAYELEVSKAGFNTTTKTNISVAAGSTTNEGVIYLVSSSASPGKISGTTINSNDGVAINGATINIYDWSGSLVDTQNPVTNSFQSINLTAGAYTVVVSKVGFFDITVDNVIVNGNVNVGQVALCEILTEPHVRVTVQWGGSPAPRDLDLHVVGPTSKTVSSDGTPNNRFHVYWSGQKSFNENLSSNFYSGTGDPNGTSSTTSLVQDNTNYFGPETINLFGYGSGYALGIYTYSVHNYTSATDWYAGTVPVTMRVYDSQGLVLQLTIPTGASSDQVWKAIKINVQGPSRAQRTINVETANPFAVLSFSSKSSMNW